MGLISKTLMLQLYRERKIFDLVNTKDRIYAKLNAELHGIYNDTIVWCDL